MVPYTVRPDLIAIYDIAVGVALLSHAANQRTATRQWLFRFFAGLLIWAGLFAIVVRGRSPRLPPRDGRSRAQ